MVLVCVLNLTPFCLSSIILGLPCEQKIENSASFVLLFLAGHHVHFPQDLTANTEIQIQTKGESIVNVHLGFLQHKHKYEVQFNIPVSPTSNSLTPIINTPFLAVGSVKNLGEFIVLNNNEHDYD